MNILVNSFTPTQITFYLVCCFLTLDEVIRTISARGVENFFLLPLMYKYIFFETLELVDVQFFKSHLLKNFEKLKTNRY